MSSRRPAPPVAVEGASADRRMASLRKSTLVPCARRSRSDAASEGAVALPPPSLRAAALLASAATTAAVSAGSRRPQCWTREPSKQRIGRGSVAVSAELGAGNTNASWASGEPSQIKVTSSSSASSSTACGVLAPPSLGATSSARSPSRSIHMLIGCAISLSPSSQTSASASATSSWQHKPM